jgi:hypothetical protein
MGSGRNGCPQGQRVGFVRAGMLSVEQYVDGQQHAHQRDEYSEAAEH